MIDRLAELLAAAPAEILPTVCYLCQGLIAPEFAGVDLGLAEKLAVRAVAAATGSDPGQVAASVREAGDLGTAAERRLAATHGDRPASLLVTTVVDTLHQIAQAEGPGSQGRKLDLLAGLLAQATPLEARYLLRHVTGGLRLGIGTPTILDALAQVYAGGRAARPVLERAYNICCDLGLVAATLVSGGVAAVEEIRVRPGNPVRAMLAQRLSDAGEILAKLGGQCSAEYKYDGVRIQAHRTADGAIELFTRRLERVAAQFPDVVELLRAGLGPAEAIVEGEVVAFDPAAGELRPFGEVMTRRRKHGIAEAVQEVPVGLRKARTRDTATTASRSWADREPSRPVRRRMPLRSAPRTRWRRRSSRPSPTAARGWSANRSARPRSTRPARAAGNGSSSSATTAPSCPTPSIWSSSARSTGAAAAPGSTARCCWPRTTRMRRSSAR